MGRWKQHLASSQSESCYLMAHLKITGDYCAGNNTSLRGFLPCFKRTREVVINDTEEKKEKPTSENKK